MVSKAKTMKRHAKKRALQRYNMPWCDLDNRRVKKMLANNQSKRSYRQSLRLVVHEVELNGKDITLVWDGLRHCVVTFLPKEFWDNIIDEEGDR